MINQEPYFKTDLGTLYHADCFELMKEMESASVDMILTDPPYGNTACTWDSKINLQELFDEWARILKPNGALVSTAMFKFGCDMVVAADKKLPFRYDLVWQKTKSCGFFNSNRMPMRAHENILVFYKKLPTYNPQMVPGKPYTITQRKCGEVYGRKECTSTVNHGTRFPTSMLTFNSLTKTHHPTEKPQELFEWLIKTYTNPGDLVFDPFAGSGTTAAAAEVNGRRWIISELEEKYCRYIASRLEGRTAA